MPILTNSRKTGLISIPPLAQPFSSFFANLVCVLSKSCEMNEKITFSISHSACLHCKRDDDGDDDENDDHDAYYDDGSQKRITILCPNCPGQVEI